MIMEGGREGLGASRREGLGQADGQQRIGGRAEHRGGRSTPGTQHKRRTLVECLNTNKKVAPKKIEQWKDRSHASKLQRRDKHEEEGSIQHLTSKKQGNESDNEANQ